LETPLGGLGLQEAAPPVGIEAALILKLVIYHSPIKTHEPTISQALFARTNSGPLSCCTSAFNALAASLTKILLAIEDSNSSTLQH
jgi:hypothetical protein